MWSYTDRTSYEAALRRANLELLKANQVAIAAGDEGASEDLLQINVEVERLRRDSVAAGASRRPGKVSRSKG